MKISLSVIFVITILSVAIPYLLFILAGKKKNSRFAKIFKNENLLPKIKEQCNNYFIGIDALKNSLIYIKLIDGNETINIIDLNQLKNCNIKVSHKGNDATSIQNLDLELSLENKTTITLNLFNIDEGYSQDFEIERAEKWKSLIEKHTVKTISEKKAA